MAEALAVVGLVAAIAQFIEYASRLSTRLDELSSSTSGFASLSARLTAVVAVVKRIHKQTELDMFDSLEGQAFMKLINSTSRDVNSLLGLLDKALPGVKDSSLARYIRAVKSLSGDKEIQRVISRLNSNIQVISLFQTTALVDRAHGYDGGASKHVSTCSRDTDEPVSVRDVSSIGSAGDLIPMSDQPDGVLTPPSEADGVNETVDFTEYVNGQRPVVDVASAKELGLSEGRPSTINRGCAPSCSCVCHRSYQLATPALFKSIVGRGTIAYTGASSFLLPCTERKCQRGGQTSASMTYRLPQWLLPLALHATLSSTALNTHINLNTLRILPDSAGVFSVLSRGDLPKLRKLFTSNRASIYDVSTSNWTLLHTAYTLGHMHMASFLLQQGADPTIAADNGSNVIERAWFFAQQSAESPGDYVLSNNDVLKAIDLDEFMSQQQYSLIHKIVLGLCKLPLSDVLTSSTSEIDKQDIRGNTPLWWAAAQGNLAAIGTLLDFGADQNIGGGLNQLPLHVARDAATVNLLCRYGARIDALDTLGRTPLHCFCYRQMGANASLVRAALKHGANVNSKASGRQTPLHYACMFGNVELIKPLLDGGADVEALMRSELTPLAAAVRYDQTEAVKLLILSLPDAPSHNVRRFRLLECAAAWAGVQLMDVLVDSLHTQASSEEVSLDEARVLWKAYEERPLRWDELDEAVGRLLAALGVDVPLLFAGGQSLKTHRCSSETGCMGCLSLPGSFCG